MKDLHMSTLPRFGHLRIITSSDKIFFTTLGCFLRIFLNITPLKLPLHDSIYLDEKYSKINKFLSVVSNSLSSSYFPPLIKLDFIRSFRILSVHILVFSLLQCPGIDLLKRSTICELISCLPLKFVRLNNCFLSTIKIKRSGILFQTFFRDLSFDYIFQKD